jgi:hypothetical protein
MLDLIRAIASRPGLKPHLVDAVAGDHRGDLAAAADVEHHLGIDRASGHPGYGSAQGVAGAGFHGEAPEQGLQGRGRGVRQPLLERL